MLGYMFVGAMTAVAGMTFQGFTALCLRLERHFKGMGDRDMASKLRLARTGVFQHTAPAKPRFILTCMVIIIWPVYWMFALFSIPLLWSD